MKFGKTHNRIAPDSVHINVGGQSLIGYHFFGSPIPRRSMKGFYLELNPLKNCLEETQKTWRIAALKNWKDSLKFFHPKTMLLGASKMPSWQPLQKNPRPNVCGWMIRQKATSQQCLSGWNCCRGRCHTQFARQQSWEWKRPIPPFRLAGTKMFQELSKWLVNGL